MLVVQAAFAEEVRLAAAAGQELRVEKRDTTANATGASIPAATLFTGILELQLEHPRPQLRAAKQYSSKMWVRRG